MMLRSGWLWASLPSTIAAGCATTLAGIAKHCCLPAASVDLGEALVDLVQSLVLMAVVVGLNTCGAR